VNQIRVRALVRFLLFGVAAVSIDYSVLNFAMMLGLFPSASKAAGYIAALTFTVAFVTRFVFGTATTSLDKLLVLALYLTTGTLNVLIFEVSIVSLLSIQVSFLNALVCTSILNFLGLNLLMRYQSSRT